MPTGKQIRPPYPQPSPGLGSWFWDKSSVPLGELIALHHFVPKPGIINPNGGWPGGPHLHYGGKIYPLTTQQWALVSSVILKEARAKLAKTKTIGFDAGVALGDVITRI
jgi:hypothetical protein